MSNIALWCEAAGWDISIGVSCQVGVVAINDVFQSLTVVRLGLVCSRELTAQSAVQ